MSIDSPVAQKKGKLVGKNPPRRTEVPRQKHWP